MADQGLHILVVCIAGAMYLAPGSDEDALHDIDTVRIVVYDLRGLRHVRQDHRQLLRFRCHGISIPIVEKTDDELPSCRLPAMEQLIQERQPAVADRAGGIVLEIKFQQNKTGFFLRLPYLGNIKGCLFRQFIAMDLIPSDVGVLKLLCRFRTAGGRVSDKAQGQEG